MDSTVTPDLKHQQTSNLMDLVAIETENSRIPPTGSRKGNPDVEDEDLASNRYPTVRYIYAGLPDTYRRDGFYEDFMASFGECRRNDGKRCQHEFPSWFTYRYRFGRPVLEIYGVKLCIENPEEAKRMYRVEYSKPNSLYGVIKVGSPFIIYGVESEGDFLYKVGRDESSATVEFSGNVFELPLNLKQPFSIVNEKTLAVALKLNGVDLLVGSDKEDVDDEGNIMTIRKLVCPPYHFEDEDITCGRFHFMTEIYYCIKKSSVRSKLVWGPYTCYATDYKRDEVCPNPIAVYLKYGLLIALTAEVTSVTVLDPSVTAVSGHISASFCSLDPEVEVLLFQGSQRDLEPVTRNVALARSFVAVPYNSYLLLQVQLHDQHGKPVVNATFPFPPLAESNFVSETDNISICVEFRHDPPRSSSDD